MRPIKKSIEDDQDEDIGQTLAGLLPELKLHALYLTRSDQLAEDLVQRTCLRAWSRQDQYEPGTNFKRWAITIMQTLWFGELRQRRRRQEEELVEPDQQSVDTFENGILAQLMVSDIRRVCTQLSDEDYALLMKIHAYGFTYKEVSNELGVPIGTVLSRASRAKGMIRAALQQRSEGSLAS